MIVKNERAVIERCLNSVKPLIDYWVIVDTGSSDGTQRLIKKCMRGIPGKLYERTWVNFEHNRNEALELAKKHADYLLFIDADEELVFDTNFVLPHLDHDIYHINIDLCGIRYVRSQLVSTSVDWKWAGVVHEALVSDRACTQDILKGVTQIVRAEGCRSQDPDKFLKDVALLEQALKKEPKNSRYQFYLAQSYRDAQMLDEAIKNYEKRIEMGGWDQEVFWSKYQIAIMKEILGKPSDEVIKAYSEAYSFRPSRAEPLYRLSSFLRRQGANLLGYFVACQALSQDPPSDTLFVEDWVYTYGLLLEKAVNAYWIGKYAECLTLSQNILKQEKLPQSIIECVEQNIGWAVKMLLPLPKERRALSDAVECSAPCSSQNG